MTTPDYSTTRKLTTEKPACFDIPVDGIQTLLKTPDSEHKIAEGGLRLQIQQEVEQSSWFGFSLVIKENAPFDRKQLVKTLQSAEIECRPIVTGNFLKNKAVLKFFDYEVSGTLEAAEYIDQQGLFVGNHQVPLNDELHYLKLVIDQLTP